MNTLKLVLLILQIISCAVLTVVIMFQNGKEDGMSALTGSSGSYLGKNKAATLDAKLNRVTKWIAAAFVLLTLFVSMLYAA